MKRITSSILIALLLISTAAAAIAQQDQTDYEKKLEYKRKKIQIMVKTSYMGEATGYKSIDTWSSTVSPKGGYSYTYSAGTERTEKTSSIKEISNWVIIRGGVRELSDVEFLEITGNTAEAEALQEKLDERGSWMMYGTIGGIIGIGVAVAGSLSGDMTTTVAGSVVSIIGFLMSSFNLPQKHYIAADYALEQADLYNIRIKRELGLPVEFE